MSGKLGPFHVTWSDRILFGAALLAIIVMVARSEADPHARGRRARAQLRKIRGH